MRYRTSIVSRVTWRLGFVHPCSLRWRCLAHSEDERNTLYFIPDLGAMPCTGAKFPVKIPVDIGLSQNWCVAGRLEGKCYINNYRTNAECQWQYWQIICYWRQFSSHRQKLFVTLNLAVNVIPGSLSLEMDCLGLCSLEMNLKVCPSVYSTSGRHRHWWYCFRHPVITKSVGAQSWCGHLEIENNLLLLQAIEPGVLGLPEPVTYCIHYITILMLLRTDGM